MSHSFTHFICENGNKLLSPEMENSENNSLLQ